MKIIGKAHGSVDGEGSVYAGIYLNIRRYSPQLAIKALFFRNGQEKHEE